MENIVWNRITNSARKKFDFILFEKSFSDINENIAENIVFQVILGYASNKTGEIISLEIFNQILLMGFKWNLDDIKEFVFEKKKLFEIEIFTTQLAISMLQEGGDPLAVLNAIDPLLA